MGAGGSCAAGCRESQSRRHVHTWWWLRAPAAHRQQSQRAIAPPDICARAPRSCQSRRCGPWQTTGAPLPEIKRTGHARLPPFKTACLLAPRDKVPGAMCHVATATVSVNCGRGGAAAGQADRASLRSGTSPAASQCRCCPGGSYCRQYVHSAGRPPLPRRAGYWTGRRILKSHRRRRKLSAGGELTCCPPSPRAVPPPGCHAVVVGLQYSRQHHECPACHGPSRLLETYDCLCI